MGWIWHQMLLLRQQLSRMPTWTVDLAYWMVNSIFAATGATNASQDHTFAMGLINVPMGQTNRLTVSTSDAGPTSHAQTEGDACLVTLNVMDNQAAMIMMRWGASITYRKPPKIRIILIISKVEIDILIFGIFLFSVILIFGTKIFLTAFFVRLSVRNTVRILLKALFLHIDFFVLRVLYKNSSCRTSDFFELGPYIFHFLLF